MGEPSGSPPVSTPPEPPSWSGLHAEFVDVVRDLAAALDTTEGRIRALDVATHSSGSPRGSSQSISYDATREPAPVNLDRVLDIRDVNVLRRIQDELTSILGPSRVNSLVTSPAKPDEIVPSPSAARANTTAVNTDAARVEALQQQLAAAQNQAVALEASLNEARTQHRAALVAIEEHVATASRERDARVGAEANLAGLSMQLAEASAQATEAEAAKAVAIEEAALERARTASMMNLNQEAANEIMRLKEERDTATTTVNTAGSNASLVSTELQTTKRFASELETEVATLRATNAALRTELTTANETLAATKRDATGAASDQVTGGVRGTGEAVAASFAISPLRGSPGAGVGAVAMSPAAETAELDKAWKEIDRLHAFIADLQAEHTELKTTHHVCLTEAGRLIERLDREVAELREQQRVSGAPSPQRGPSFAPSPTRIDPQEAITATDGRQSPKKAPEVLPDQPADAAPLPPSAALTLDDVVRSSAALRSNAINVATTIDSPSGHVPLPVGTAADERWRGFESPTAGRRIDYEAVTLPGVRYTDEDEERTMMRGASGEPSVDQGRRRPGSPPRSPTRGSSQDQVERGSQRAGGAASQLDSNNRVDDLRTIGSVKGGAIGGQTTQPTRTVVGDSAPRRDGGNNSGDVGDYGGGGGGDEFRGEGAVANNSGLDRIQGGDVQIRTNTNSGRATNNSGPAGSAELVAGAQPPRPDGSIQTAGNQSLNNGRPDPNDGGETTTDAGTGGIAGMETGSGRGEVRAPSGRPPTGRRPSQDIVVPNVARRKGSISSQSSAGGPRTGGSKLKGGANRALAAPIPSVAQVRQDVDARARQRRTDKEARARSKRRGGGGGSDEGQKPPRGGAMNWRTSAFGHRKPPPVDSDDEDYSDDAGAGDDAVVTQATTNQPRGPDDDTSSNLSLSVFDNGPGAPSRRRTMNPRRLHEQLDATERQRQVLIHNFTESDHEREKMSARLEEAERMVMVMHQQTLEAVTQPSAAPISTALRASPPRAAVRRAPPAPPAVPVFSAEEQRWMEEAIFLRGELAVANAHRAMTSEDLLSAQEELLRRQAERDALQAHMARLQQGRASTSANMTAALASAEARREALAEANATLTAQLAQFHGTQGAPQ